MLRAALYGTSSLMCDKDEAKLKYLYITFLCDMVMEMDGNDFQSDTNDHQMNEENTILFLVQIQLDAHEF